MIVKKFFYSIVAALTVVSAGEAFSQGGDLLSPARLKEVYDIKKYNPQNILCKDVYRARRKSNMEGGIYTINEDKYIPELFSYYVLGMLASLEKRDKTGDSSAGIEGVRKIINSSLMYCQDNKNENFRMSITGRELPPYSTEGSKFDDLTCADYEKDYIYHGIPMILEGSEEPVIKKDEYIDSISKIFFVEGYLMVNGRSVYGDFGSSLLNLCKSNSGEVSFFDAVRSLERNFEYIE